MKNFSFLFLVVVLALGVVACGNKNSSSGPSSSFSSDPYKVSTVNGYLDINQPVVQVGNITYQVSQNSYSVMNQAFSLARQQGIQPTMVNGSQKFKARITGSLASQTGYQQYPQQQQGMGNTLNITQAVIYR
jgi:hypothetical protein